MTRVRRYKREPTEAPHVSLKFHKKVQVYGPDGRYIFSAHPDEAQRLVGNGATVSVKNDVVRAIQLPHSCVSTSKLPSGTAIGGTRFTYELHLEHGVLTQHKFIHEDDRPLFRQVQSDCMAGGQ